MSLAAAVFFRRRPSRKRARSIALSPVLMVMPGMTNAAQAANAVNHSQQPPMGVELILGDKPIEYEVLTK